MAVKEPLALVFDVGTQSTRALLFNKKGDLIKKIKVEEDLYISKEDNYAEKSCVETWDGICEVSKQLKDSVAPEVWQDIVVVSVTTIRNSLAYLDKYYQPTRNTIMWLDKREVECEKKLPLLNRALYKLVGMDESVRVMRKTGNTNWVRENQPEVWARTAKICMISAYFNYRLTGRLADSKAAQSAKLPYNYKKRKWHTHKELNYPIFGCDISKMCELVEPGDTIGYITKKTSEETGLKVGLPVIASGADKHCETIGTGCFDTTLGSLSFGTATCIEITTDKYIEPGSFMPAFTAAYPGKFNPEIQAYRGFWMVSWFKHQFAQIEQIEAKEKGISVEQLLDEKLLQVPLGCNGLILQPFWGPGLCTPEAKGAIIGFSDEHTRMYIYRAIIEGLGYCMLDGLEVLEKRAKCKVGSLAVSGGGSQSNIICQIMADIFGRRIFRVQTYETSGLGAALISFVGINEFETFEDARESMVHQTVEFLPNQANHTRYMQYFNRVYKKMYKCMKPMYDELYDILGDNRK